MNQLERSKKRYFLLGLVVLQGFFILHLGSVGWRTYSYVVEERRLEDITTRYDRIVPGSDKSILIIGDSLAYGIGTTTPEASIAGQLAQHYPEHSVINRSVIGDETKDLAAAVEGVVDSKHDIIVAVIGGNDILRYRTNLDLSGQHLDTIAKRMAERADQAYLITTSDFKLVSFSPWFTRSYFSDRSHKLRTLAMAASDQHNNVSYIDFFDVSSEDYAGYEATDGFHLNDAGTTVLVGRIVQAHNP